ncbi:MAG: iron complex outermembrane receptor protein [Lysobacterales bacterium]|jgi:iron complex outermembrane receptor protein
MKINRNPLSNAVRNSLSSVLVLGLAATPLAVIAQDDADDEEGVELDRVQVTGSRIKRTDVEGALPVTVIDRDMIELSGESSAADMLRNLTFNSAGSSRPASGSSAQGVSSVALRGIGSSRTLVLVDGRRLPKSPSTGANQDLNQIPLGAIERIEVLTDGASAIYGTDAIGGVINVVLREDFQGAELMIGQASITHEGGDREEGSIAFGASSSTSRLIGGVSWNDRDIIFARDLPWNRTGASIYGNSFTTLTGGYDNFDWTSYGGGNSCDYPGTGFFTTGSSASVNGTRCAYDFTLVSADEASTSNKSLYIKASHEINNDWSVWMNASANSSWSFGRYAPVPDSSYFSVPLTAASPNNPTNPASSLYDPAFGPPASVNWWHRFDSLGNRDSEVENLMNDFTFGMTGWVGNAEVDFGLRKTKNKTYDIGRNYLLRSAASALIESGAYDLEYPSQNPASVLNSMKVVISRISNYDQDEAFASVAWDMFELDAGPVQWFAGAEYREVRYFDRYDSLSEAGQVGGSAGNSAGGIRDVTSFFFETLLPFGDNFEVSIAGRSDDYSDYGSDFSPKVSVRWQATDELVLRASVGEGFHAPTLDIITQLDSFSADTVADPQSCLAQGQTSSCRLQVNATVTANPSLSSEQSDQFSIGGAWAPTDWFNMTLDYYDIEISNRIRSFGSQGLINSTNAGDPVPAGLGVTRNPNNGAILNITRGFGNEGDLATSGFDINAKFSFEIGSGRLSNNFQYSQILDYTIDNGRDRVEDPGLPEYRAVLSNLYEIGDFSFAWNTNAIGPQCDDLGCPNGLDGPPTWVTNDLQVNYFTPWDGKVTIGSRNVTDKLPPIGLGDVGSREYDFRNYDGYGRVVYARYTQTF